MRNPEVGVNELLAVACEVYEALIVVPIKIQSQRARKTQWKTMGKVFPRRKKDKNSSFCAFPRPQRKEGSTLACFVFT